LIPHRAWPGVKPGPTNFRGEEMKKVPKFARFDAERFFGGPGQR